MVSSWLCRSGAQARSHAARPCAVNRYVNGSWIKDAASCQRAGRVCSDCSVNVVCPSRHVGDCLLSSKQKEGKSPNDIRILLQARGFSESGLKSANVSANDPSGFIKHFRSAAPYIACHRGCTFLVVLPGEAMLDKNIVVCLRTEWMLNAAEVGLCGLPVGHMPRRPTSPAIHPACIRSA